jgi:hypothetical protein
MTSVDANGNVKVANIGRDESKLKEDECYKLFLRSRTKRFATKFGRSDWASTKGENTGETGKSQMTVSRERETIQRNWLANRAMRFSSVTTTMYED